jgi:Cu/Ag efflux protein CusF
MKKIVAVLAVAAVVLSLASLAFAALAQQGTIKSVDVKSGTIVFCTEGGKDVTLKADKSIDLDKIKAGDKVEVSVEDGTVKSVKAGHVGWCPEGY